MTKKNDQTFYSAYREARRWQRRFWLAAVCDLALAAALLWCWAHGSH
jgi:hypothetical protein